MQQPVPKRKNKNQNETGGRIIDLTISSLGLEIPSAHDDKGVGIEQTVNGVKYTALVHFAENAKETVKEKFMRILTDAVERER